MFHRHHIQRNHKSPGILRFLVPSGLRTYGHTGGEKKHLMWWMKWLSIRVLATSLAYHAPTLMESWLPLHASHAPQYTYLHVQTFLKRGLGKVKITGCSSRGRSRFNSQHLQYNSTVCQPSSRAFDALFWFLRVLHCMECIYVYKTFIRKKIRRKIVLKK